MDQTYASNGPTTGHNGTCSSSGNIRVDTREQENITLSENQLENHSQQVTTAESSNGVPSDSLQLMLTSGTDDSRNSPLSGTNMDVTLEFAPLTISPRAKEAAANEIADQNNASPKTVNEANTASSSATNASRATSSPKAVAFNQENRLSFANARRRRRSPSSDSSSQRRTPPQRPPPVAPEFPQLTIRTPRPLPAETPQGHTHHLINDPPWAGYVKSRGCLPDINPNFITSILPTTIYKQLGGGGYLSLRFVRSLFPRTFREQPSTNSPLPVYELMRLDHAVSFRKATQAIIDRLFSHSYIFEENQLPQTPRNSMPSVVLPPERDSFPVLYQVVYRGHGQGVVLEAKDFFVVGPDRRELHFLVLDQYATNIISNTRGFDRALLSIKDLVWVYTAEPTQAALRNPAQTLAKARIPKATALDNRAPHFFRVKEFTFVTPPPTPDPILGIILSVTNRGFGVANVKIALESAPEAVTVSPTICDFPIQEAEVDEVVLAVSRRNVSCAMRFSEPPVSLGAQDFLCGQARLFLPSHPEEGLLPLRVSKLPREDRAWIDDRLGQFWNYERHPGSARRRMGQLFNVACSALSAVNLLNDDKRTHNIMARIPSLEAFPVRLDFSLPDMSSECGWTNQRPVYLWVVGSQSLCRAIIQDTSYSTENRTLSIRVVAPSWAHRSTINAIRRFGVLHGPDNITIVNIYVKLGPIPSGADPVYEIISNSRLFDSVGSSIRSTALEILNTVYGNSRQDYRPAGRSQENNHLSLEGSLITLGRDQTNAIRLGDGRYPIVGIQAALGTGKTVVGAVTAAQAAQAGKGVIVTSTTNTAVAQFADTLKNMDDFQDVVVLRYVSDTALTEGAPQTPNDMHKILKRLHIDYEGSLNDQEREICRRFAHGRELLERFMFQPDLALSLSEEEREEYRLAEKDISKITSDVVVLMFRLRRPSVICLTTAALLNATDTGGIFQNLLSSYTKIVGDEASQIPEPAFVAMANRLSDARHVYIGDVHQLEPQVRCSRSSIAARLGALGVMELLLAKRVPMAPLTVTYRAHPALIELPNRLFYDHTLSSGVNPGSRRLLLDNSTCPNPKVPFIFVKIAGHSQRAPSGSHWHDREAQACRDIIRMLLSSAVEARSIAVITFYKEQYRKLESFTRSQHVDLYTVDAVQGREKDIVIFLTTRSHFEAERAQFLDEPRRMNVVLTRARHGLIVLGHEQSLRELQNWGELLQWAHRLDVYREAAELPDLFR